MLYAQGGTLSAVSGGLARLASGSGNVGLAAPGGTLCAVAGAELHAEAGSLLRAAAGDTLSLAATVNLPGACALVSLQGALCGMTLGARTAQAWRAAGAAAGGRRRRRRRQPAGQRRHCGLPVGAAVAAAGHGQHGGLPGRHGRHASVSLRWRLPLCRQRGRAVTGRRRRPHCHCRQQRPLSTAATACWATAATSTRRPRRARCL